MLKKDELRELAELKLKELVDNSKENYIIHLEKENKQLKERIDKAIEYTRNANFPDWFVTKDQYDEAFAYEMLHIREILKGDSNE